MLIIKDLSITRADRLLLHPFSAELKGGELVALCGRNGSGKSSLFDALAGRLSQSSGQILFEGEDVTTTDERARAPFIGRLFQDPAKGSLMSLSIRENLALCKARSRRARLASLEHLDCEELNDFDLETPMHALSGGQRQLIAFVMATLHRPKLLLLDEPTAALDESASGRLLTHLTHYLATTRASALLITHDEAIAQSCTRRWVVDKKTVTML